MSRDLTAQKVEEVPQTATVSDYDELTEDQQTTLRRLVAGEAVEAATLDSDIVRFTGYYSIDSPCTQASD